MDLAKLASWQAHMTHEKNLPKILVKLDQIKNNMSQAPLIWLMNP